MRLLLALLLLPLVGCPPSQKLDAEADETGETGPAEADADLDGFRPSEGDCDDADPAVNPAAEETCNTRDDNCDGTIDEGVRTDFWPDSDVDGYGDAGSTPTPACEGEPGTGTAATGDDCDDADAAIHPDAEDVCDGVDNDCDANIDEDGATQTWYADSDLDGYGDDTTAVDACENPLGYIATGGDCDDGSAAFHPGAEEADCTDPTDYNCDGSSGFTDGDGDGYAACADCDDSAATVNDGADEICNEIDDNCDATIDEDTALDVADWYVDADGDGFGDLTLAVAACAPPEGYVSEGSDCDDLRATDNPAGTESCDERDNDCDGTTDESDAIDATTWYIDSDADGYGDPALTRAACEPPSGFSAYAADCDDTDAAYNPGAAEECGVSSDYNCDGSVADDDADADGWIACLDCNDADPDVSPDADERCDDVDDDCDGTIDEADAIDARAWYADLDNDSFGDPAVSTTACDSPPGYVSDSEDCADADPAISPAASEQCDGVDNDCDGDTDGTDAIGTGSWFADTDGDSFGDPAVSVLACGAPLGFVADATDCDDTRTDDNPAAGETCDGYDNDCDGATDEFDAIDVDSWYRDSDGDTFGDATILDTACTAAPGYVADDTDCDDTNSVSYPGGTEVCDSSDNDCDGASDEDAVDAITWYADSDSDSFGDPDSARVSCTAPTGHVSDATDCDDTSAAVNPAESELCENGIDDDCSGDETECQLSGTALATTADHSFAGIVVADYVGSAAAGGGDLDGDGVDDLVLGSYGWDNGATPSVGKTYVFYGPIDAGDTLATADATLTGTQSAESAGTALAIVGDTDGDGADDLLVGAHLYNHGSVTDVGNVYLVPGGSTGSLVSQSSTTFQGEVASDFLGYALDGAGDVDGDGTPDILLGAYNYDSPANNTGGAGLWYGGTTGANEAFSGADVLFRGTLGSDTVGWALSRAGDVDGDGIDDLLIGGFGVDTAATNAGAAYLVYGPPSASVLGAATADATVTGAAASDRLGYSVTELGDTDGDGKDDFAVAADSADNAATDAGAVYVFTATLSGSVSATAARATLTGVTASDYAGRSLAGPGDTNGDGYADLAISAFGYDTGATAGVGAIYLTYGPFTSGSLSAAGAIRTGTNALDGVGYALASGGDTNGDAYDDLLFGAILADPRAVSNAGSAWLFYGSGI